MLKCFWMELRGLNLIKAVGLQHLQMLSVFGAYFVQYLQHSLSSKIREM